MSMTIQEAIKRINEHMSIHHIGQYPHILLAEALHMALDALREKALREDPQPLTLEELHNMVGEPVYIVYASAEPCEWVVFDHHDDGGFGTSDNSWWFARGYGIAWEAYRHKPKDVTDINVGNK